MKANEPFIKLKIQMLFLFWNTHTRRGVPAVYFPVPAPALECPGAVVGFMLYSTLDVLSTHSDMDRMSRNDSWHLVLQNNLLIIPHTGDNESLDQCR